ncbi:MAG: hypothetical protein NC120_12330 [Ruminococcus sp.]|nr:hypothetical protein [Ruminococcus sp.]
MDKQQIIGMIQRYRDEHLFEPNANWPFYHFKERSYSRWAADRIISDIIASSNDPVTVIRSFVNTSKNFYGLGKPADDIFRAAYEVGSDILSILVKEDTRL